MSMADSARPSAVSPSHQLDKPGAPALVLRGLSKRFGERVILDAVSLRIEPGERVALLGESGSGKSTLLNLIAGLEPADAGSIEIAGHPLHGLDDDAAAVLRRNFIGFAFQAFHLLAHLDAKRNVAVPLLLAGTPPSRAIERARALLDRLGLAARADAPVRELSGGEQQRVALARALVGQPALVLADEPTGNLDPRNARAALELIAEQARLSGAALLLVTHSHEAAEVAERRLLLRDGQLTTE